MIDPSPFLSFIFGAIVGSFLNVVSLRFDTGVGLNGRSKCMSCGTKLTWRELIPIFSFLAQKGSCRTCKSKISWQYPLVEFLAGAVFTLIFIVFNPSTPEAALSTFIYIVASCFLLVIAAYDIKHQIIPDQFSYSFAALGFIQLWVGGASWWHVPSWQMMIAGPLVALPFALLWLLSKGKWMGLGDAKLMLGIGWFLGVNGGTNAAILAFWIAAVLSVGWLLATYKRFKAGMAIPFGPYLILGFYIVLIFGVRVIDMRVLYSLIFGS